MQRRTPGDALATVMILRRRIPLSVPIATLQKEQRASVTRAGGTRPSVTHWRHMACPSGPLARSAVSDLQNGQFIPNWPEPEMVQGTRLSRAFP